MSCFLLKCQIEIIIFKTCIEHHFTYQHERIALRDLLVIPTIQKHGTLLCMAKNSVAILNGRVQLNDENYHLLIEGL